MALAAEDSHCFPTTHKTPRALSSPPEPTPKPGLPFQELWFASCVDIASEGESLREGYSSLRHVSTPDPRSPHKPPLLRHGLCGGVFFSNGKGLELIKPLLMYSCMRSEGGRIVLAILLGLLQLSDLAVLLVWAWHLLSSWSRSGAWQVPIV